MPVISTPVIAGTSATTADATPAMAVASGDLCLVFVLSYNQTTTVTVTGSVNGAYTQIGSYVTTGGGDRRVSLWYCQNSGSGTETVTVHPNQSAYLGVGIVTISGMQTSSVLNASATGSGTSTTPSTGSITAAAGDLVIAAFGGSGYITATFKVTTPMGLLFNLASSTYQPMCGLAGIAAGNTTASLVSDTSYGWAAIGASFKVLASGGGTSRGMPPIYDGMRDP